MKSKTPLRIREARSNDAPYVCEAQLRMALETENLQLDPATVQKGVQAVFDDPSRGRYFVAETLPAQNGPSKLAACLLTMPEWSDWRNGTVLWIHSLYVEPEFRRAGVFKQMYAHLKQLVDSSEAFRGLRLYVDKRNTIAQRAYLDVGMSAEHYDLYEWLKA